MKSAMRFSGLAIACVVLLALSGVLYWSGHHKAAKAASTASTTPVIIKVNPSSVTGFTIQQKGSAPVTLAKQSTGVWQITAPKTLPASQNAVTGVLSNLSPLNGERVIETNATDLKPYGLNDPSVTLDVTEKDHAEQKLLFGDNTPTGDSAYAMVAGDPRIFTTYLFNKTDVNKGLDDLRDTRLITSDPEMMSHIEVTRAGEDLEFARNKGNWEILKPGPYRADLMTVDGLADALSGVHMDLTGDGSKDADADFAQGAPVATVKVTGNTGTQTLEVRKDKDNYYAKSSLVSGAYLIDSSLSDSLNKKLDDYRNKVVFDFSYNEPNEVDLQIVGQKPGASTQSWYLKQSGDQWWWDGKKMDADSVEQVVSALRDLTATKFASSGFTTPEIVATVTSSGNHVEKVMIAKSATSYLAKRADEPTLYVLDGGAVEGLRSAAEKMHVAGPAHK